jgi:hypothetical protein
MAMTARVLQQAAVHQQRQHMPLGEARAACPAGTDLASRSWRKSWTGCRPSRFPLHRTFHGSQAAFGNRDGRQVRQGRQVAAPISIAIILRSAKIRWSFLIAMAIQMGGENG